MPWCAKRSSLGCRGPNGGAGSNPSKHFPWVDAGLYIFIYEVFITVTESYVSVYETSYLVNNWLMCVHSLKQRASSFQLNNNKIIMEKKNGLALHKIYGIVTLDKIMGKGTW